MYRQIRVHPQHSPLQRIVFRDSITKQVQDYELQTVTFGVNCAPYLAIRTLLQLADDSENEFPLAAHILRKCMYVDDVLAGAHDLETALAARDQLIIALSSAKFELRKWTANDKTILARFPPEHLVDAQLLSFVEASSSKPLGIRWNARLDCFYFEVCSIGDKQKYSKREVLSAIAKLFDPVGWLAPVIVTAKMIMQKVWLDNIGWDDSLLAATEAEWKSMSAKVYTEEELLNVDDGTETVGPRPSKPHGGMSSAAVEAALVETIAAVQISEPGSESIAMDSSVALASAVTPMQTESESISVCDNELRIRYVDSSHPGAYHDSFIWNTSKLRSFFEDKYLLGENNYWLQ
ncbi:uncharacterized protein LOC133321354, partial [Musca vetustissima]|uniref:uncharacterized protein LOC133321354 n=1 Tax=Musca vetustissima TaxID=27455 RepID=UPI002AB64DCE